MRRPIEHPKGTPYPIPSRSPLRRAKRGEATPDLEHAELTGADLRGLDLTGANLRGADMRGARCGMSPGWAVFVNFSALLVSLGVGVACGFLGGALQRSLLGDDLLKRFVAGFLVCELVILLVGSAWKGPGAVSRWLVPPLLVMALTGDVLALLLGLPGLAAIGITLGTALMVCLLALGALARATAGATSRLLFFVVAFSGALVSKELGGGLIAVGMALSGVIVGRRVLSDPASAPFIARIALAIVCARGTSFRGADLREAQLQGVRFDGCDFRDASLDGAQWSRARTCLAAFDPSPVPKKPS